MARLFGAQKRAMQYGKQATRKNADIGRVSLKAYILIDIDVNYIIVNICRNGLGIYPEEALNKLSRRLHLRVWVACDYRCGSHLAINPNPQRLLTDQLVQNFSKQ